VARARHRGGGHRGRGSDGGGGGRPRFHQSGLLPLVTLTAIRFAGPTLLRSRRAMKCRLVVAGPATRVGSAVVALAPADRHVAGTLALVRVSDSAMTAPAQMSQARTWTSTRLHHHARLVVESSGGTAHSWTLMLMPLPRSLGRPDPSRGGRMAGRFGRSQRRSGHGGGPLAGTGRGCSGWRTGRSRWPPGTAWR
jgi:hypothetical protein